MADETLQVELTEYQSTAEPVPLPDSAADVIRVHMSRFLDIMPAWGAPGTYWLTAKQYIGDIVVGDVRIRIGSEKAPMENLFWMLTYAEDLADFRGDDAGFTADEGLFEYLARMFAGQVEQVLRRGMYRTYMPHADRLPRLRGRLNIAEQMRQGIIHPERFSVCWNEHTPDVLENRLLKRVLAMLAAARFSREPQLARRLRRSASMFDIVSLIAVADRDFGSVRFNQLNDHYRRPLALARVLYRYMHLRNEQGSVPFVTYLIDLNDLFERFIAAFLAEALSGTDLAVRDQYQVYLDADHLEPAQVDVVLTRERQPVLALDTKFKVYGGKPARADLNQMFGYCHALGIDRGILLYPRAQGLQERRRMPEADVEMRSVWLGGSLMQLRAHLESVVSEMLSMTDEAATEVLA